MPRKVGVAAIQKQQLAQAKFRDKGAEIADANLQQMTKQMEVFRNKLQEFASKHKNEIRKDPNFRRQFQEMCATAGVDPLASSKGFWANILGVGDFYYELGIQIVEVCLSTVHRNGGLINLEKLQELVIESRGSKEASNEVSVDDMVRAIEKLKILGNGFRLIPSGSKYIVQSVPSELSMDHTAVVLQAENVGFVSHSSIKKNLGWDDARIEKALEDIMKEGMIWVDDQAKERLYWFPAFWKGKDA